MTEEATEFPYSPIEQAQVQESVSKAWAQISVVMLRIFLNWASQPNLVSYFCETGVAYPKNCVWMRQRIWEPTTEPHTQQGLTILSVKILVSPGVPAGTTFHLTLPTGVLCLWTLLHILQLSGLKFFSLHLIFFSSPSFWATSAVCLYLLLDSPYGNGILTRVLRITQSRALPSCWDPTHHVDYLPDSWRNRA